MSRVAPLLVAALAWLASNAGPAFASDASAPSRGTAKAWVGTETLRPPRTGEGAVGDRYGWAISASGGTLAVGVPVDRIVAPGSPNGRRTGSVSVYDVAPNGDATRLVRLTPAIGGEGDLFGFSVALDGDLLVVGAPFTDAEDVADTGAAFVYERSGATWSLVAELALPSAVADARFGWAVALANGRVYVGAPGIGVVRVYADAGAGYVLEQAIVSEAPLPPVGDSIEQQFGAAIAADGDVLFVAAPRGEASGAPEDSGIVFRYDRGATWTRTAAIASDAPVVSGSFGISLAFDGDLLVVGASGEPDGLSSAAGRASVYAVGPASTTLVEALVAAQRTISDLYGDSVAVDGDAILVGSPGAFVAEGAAYFHRRAGNDVALESAYTVQDGGGPDFLGSAVAIDGDRAYVSADLDSVAENRSQGAVRVFDRVGGAWTPVAQIDTGAGAELEAFGSALAAEGDVLAVGAPFEDTETANDDAGVVRLHRRVGGAMVPIGVLEPPGADSDEWFGFAVALAGDVLVVGAPRDKPLDNFERGAAYVFRRTTPTTWVLEQRLVPSDSEPSDVFGASVATDGTTIAIGAPLEDGDGDARGAVYAYVRSNGAWVLQQALRAAQARDGDQLGTEVRVRGGLIVAGAPGASVGTAPAVGRVHTFRRGVAWTESATIASPATDPGTNFGFSLAIAPDESIIVGAFGEWFGDERGAGAAYELVPSATGWTARTRFVAAAPAEFDNFGAAIALRDGRLLIGAPGIDLPVANAGQVYAYERTATGWSAPQVLSAPAPEVRGLYGSTIALASNFLAVGEPERDGVGPDEGAVYVYADDERVFADSFE